MQIEGNFIDVVKGEIYPAKISFSDKIKKVQRTNKKYSNYICPGFIDSHIRVEDSFLNPVEFTKKALLSGVTTIIEDISGFLIAAGHKPIKYLISEFKDLPINFFYLYPINISYNIFEGKPADPEEEMFKKYIGEKQCIGLTQVDDIKKLNDKNHSISKKITIGKYLDKPIISNVPKINFTEMGNMTQLGIRADLGSNIYQEAFEKACFGLKIKIVEGTKRKTLTNLIRLAKQFETIIVSEEKSPQEISKGYLSSTIKRAISLGLDPVTAIKNVTINPAKLLGLEEGTLEEGKIANIVEIDNLKSFNITNVYFKGKKVISNNDVKGIKNLKSKKPDFSIDLSDISEEDIKIESKKKSEKAKVLIVDGETIKLEDRNLPVVNGEIIPKNCMKVVVANKYGENTVSIGFVDGLGINKGALATTVNGSSGNIIAVGSNDKSICLAINSLKENKGGRIVISDKKKDIFPLPIFGVCSDKNCENVIKDLKKVNTSAKKIGCEIKFPFETLGNLMHIKGKGYRITDKGLIDLNNNKIVDVFEE